MDRSLIQQGFDEHRAAGVVVDRSAAAAAETSSLPPTRAARPARSRGVFFAEGRFARYVRGAVCAVLVAVTAISIAATAPRVIDAPVVLLNPGPALVAAASKLPATFAPRH
jgi:hypothetical protein